MSQRAEETREVRSAQGICAYLEAMLGELAKLAARQGEGELAAAIVTAQEEASRSLARGIAANRH